MFIDKVKKALNFLQGIEFDQEYDNPNDTKEFWEHYDEAFGVISELLNEYKSAKTLINHARNRLGDLSRIIEKQCGDPEADDEINNRIDEIYNLLKME